MTEHHIINLSELAAARDGSGHSIFSPSGSSMWLRCLGSLIANLLTEDSAGVDAAYGTVAHELCEQWLKTGKRPSGRVGETVWVESGDWGYLITIDDEMLAYVKECVDYCRFLPGDHFVEQRVFFSEYTPLPNQSGTSDHCACLPGHMINTDHKFGKGVRVYAAKDYSDTRGVIENEDGSFVINGNPQGLLYALGFFLKWDHKYHFERITIRIAQPRLDHFDEWETTREDLLAFGEFVKKRAALAWKPNAPRSPSPEACQWCAIKHGCAANAVMQERISRAAFDDLTKEITDDDVSDLKDRLNEPLGSYEFHRAKLMTLNTEELAILFNYRASALAWWERVKKELYDRVSRGETIPGMKVVEGRSNRMFKNKNKVVHELEQYGVSRDELIEEKLVSPAEAERLLRKAGVRAKDLPNVLSPLVEKPRGKATLVPISDKRKALEEVSGLAFDDLIENREDD